MHNKRRSGLMRGYELGRWLAMTVPLCFIVMIYLIQGSTPPLVLLATAVCSWLLAPSAGYGSLEPGGQLGLPTDTVVLAGIDDLDDGAGEIDHTAGLHHCAVTRQADLLDRPAARFLDQFKLEFARRLGLGRDIDGTSAERQQYFVKCILWGHWQRPDEAPLPTPQLARLWPFVQ
jgi:hypothetical protein